MIHCFENACAEATLDCGGLMPPWDRYGTSSAGAINPSIPLSAKAASSRRNPRRFAHFDGFPVPRAAARVSIALVEKPLFDVGPKFLESIGRQDSAKALCAAQEGVLIGLTVNTPGI